MKEFLALILALTMVMGMATMVMAVDVEDSAFADGSEAVQNPVTVEVQSSAAKVYEVTVNWGNTDFVYNMGANAWNPENHTFATAGAGWSVGTNQVAITDGVKTDVTVINHSNASVYAKIAYAGATAVDGVTVGVTGAPQEMKSAAVYAYGDRDSTVDEVKADFTIQVTGAPTNPSVNKWTVANVTITISTTPFA